MRYGMELQCLTILNGAIVPSSSINFASQTNLSADHTCWSLRAQNSLTNWTAWNVHTQTETDSQLARQAGRQTDTGDIHASCNGRAIESGFSLFRLASRAYTPWTSVPLRPFGCWG